MASDMFEFLLILLLVLPAAMGQTYFVYRYARYSPTWRDSEVGRALMVVAATLALLVDMQILNELSFYTGNTELIVTTQLLEIASYLLVTVAIYWQLFTLVKTQNRERENDRRMGKGRN